MQVPQISLSQQGPKFSRLTLGLWRLTDNSTKHTDSAKLIEAAFELGITTFDHADIYGDYTCESLFAQAMAHTSLKRHQYQLVTKCGIKLISKNRPAHTIKHYDTSKTHIIASAENSLKNLKTSYLDLLLIHRPDPFMDPDEVADAFTTLRKSGKVLHFGVSNFMPHEFDLLNSHLDFPLITNQIEFSVMNAQALYDGTITQCQKLKISPMAWSPLAGGRLFSEKTKQATQVRKTLQQIVKDTADSSIDQIALAWILSHPADFIVVLGTGKIDRVEKAVQSLDIELSRPQWFDILQASNGTEVP